MEDEGSRTTPAQAPESELPQSPRQKLAGEFPYTRCWDSGTHQKKSSRKKLRVKTLKADSEATAKTQHAKLPNMRNRNDREPRLKAGGDIQKVLNKVQSTQQRSNVEALEAKRQYPKARTMKQQAHLEKRYDIARNPGVEPCHVAHAPSHLPQPSVRLTPPPPLCSRAPFFPGVAGPFVQGAAGCFLSEVWRDTFFPRCGGVVPTFALWQGPFFLLGAAGPFLFPGVGGALFAKVWRASCLGVAGPCRCGGTLFCPRRGGPCCFS